MTTPLAITSRQQDPGCLGATLDVDGQHRDWILTSSSSDLSGVLDPCLAGAILPAMAMARPIHVQGAVSEAFISRIPDIQRILAVWRRDPGRSGGPYLRTVDVQAAERSDCVVGSESALIFSGDVHSFESLIRLADTVDALIHIVDTDVAGTWPLAADAEVPAVSSAARTFDKPVISVRTNARSLYSDMVSPAGYLGSLHASVALAHAPRFGTIHVPARTDVRRLGPGGSHPFLEPRYSAGGQQVVVGPITQTWFDKLQVVSTQPRARDHLLVCESGTANCGHCPMCVLTILGLQALEQSSPALPRDTVEPDEVSAAMWMAPDLVDSFTDVGTRLDDEGLLPLHRAAVWLGAEPRPRQITRADAWRALIPMTAQRRRGFA